MGFLTHFTDFVGLSWNARCTDFIQYKSHEKIYLRQKYTSTAHTLPPVKM